MNLIYLICFVLGFILSLLSAISGLGRLHVGHLHLRGHFAGRGGHPPSGGASGLHVSPLNGLTLPTFLCWFGGVGYLLERYSSVFSLLVLAIAVLAGFGGAALLYVLLFKLLLPRERVLLPEDTRMEGTLARVSGAIRSKDTTGEILFTQTGARRASAARSEDGVPIARGTEVVVLRYERGIAYVRPLHELCSN